MARKKTTNKTAKRAAVRKKPVREKTEPSGRIKLGKKKAVKKKTSRTKELSGAQIAWDVDEGRDSAPRKVREFVDALVDGSRKDVEAFLDAGMSVNTRMFGYITPLMIAVGGGPLTIVKLLLERGADVNACPILALAWCEPGYVKPLLKAGADPNATADETPLLRAIEAPNLEVVKLLIKAGAKVGKKEVAAARQCRDVRIQKAIEPDRVPGSATPTGLSVHDVVKFGPQALKQAIPKAFEVTGVVPELLKAPPPWIYACPVDPDRFLTPTEAKRTTALDTATDRAFSKLFGSLDNCEVARSDMKGPVLLVLQSKDKFEDLKSALKEPAKWLKRRDKTNTVSLVGFHQFFRLTYQMANPLSKAEVGEWKKSFAEEVRNNEGFGWKITSSEVRIWMD